MKKLIDIVLLCAALAPVACSCLRDPILDEAEGCRVHFNSGDGQRPQGRICLCLFDRQTGKEVFKAFYGQEGGVLRSVRPGEYRAAAWTMDSEKTVISHQNDWNLLSAGTICIKVSPERIYAAPDQVLVFSSESIRVPHVAEAEGPYVLEVELRKAAEEWRIEIEGVKGLENFQDAIFLVSGQVCERNFAGWEASGECTLSQSGFADKDSGLVVCRLGTFGVASDRISLRAEIRATNGFTHVLNSDITERMLDRENSGRTIRLRFDTTLHPPVQGGLAPTADEWTEHEEAIDII